MVIFILTYCCNNIFVYTLALLCSLLSFTKYEYIFGFNPTNSLIVTPAVSSLLCQPQIYVSRLNHCQIFCVTYSMVWMSILNSLFCRLQVLHRFCFLIFSLFFHIQHCSLICTTLFHLCNISFLILLFFVC